MNYRVFWAPDAERHLEVLLQDAEAKVLIAAAARDIDQRLIADPLQFGESRHDAVHVGFVRPLGALYEVLDDVRTVIVYDVWPIDVKKR